ncbi:hypothetical protein D910_10641 [Dendroctonus ponderosae]|uniref:Ferritin n=1 Tax=Dendroctonus ponderosae TaxID=77166 RepID=U4UHA4_DENPD|nr:hypothetical protein D910_10641 [Dendroctonus ponderosae]
MAHSQVRQNFHKDCEDAINKQVNLELFCSYTYMCMAHHFQRDDVALSGFIHYFKHACDSERDHAHLLMDYQNSRGGRIALKAIEAPGRQEWDTPQEAMQDALELEKRVNEARHMDVNLCDYLETNFLQEQVTSIKEIADYVTNLKRVGEGPSCNVSTYDSLVKQKSSGSDRKKCGKNEEHPGRHKFHKEVEAALNEQIEIEFKASFAYLSMACYYGKSQVALPGCQGFFMKMHEEEHEHGIVFLNYVLMRGGQVQVPCIKPPDIQDWKDISKTFLTAVRLESQVKEKLEKLVVLAEKHRDHQLVDFVSGRFLEEHNKSIQTLGRLLTRSKMTNCDIGKHLFDLHVYESFVNNHKDNFMYKSELSEEELKRIYK